ncbi:DNA-processing protein DprA [Bacillus sp. ISL-51]|uniref:DNA-processing protein DprA n=1 Tax=Pseudomonas sp. ISL-88 TaxID=2819169 RepID=UPI001BE7B12C|nr:MULTISPECIES: DNA-processing protein DprA [Bacteria]MBT2573370.1 DNA-processing protein DprA [Bacillus sp. ISL-51]MBT2633634.1 DNA-processing protein DprA [Bacillus sp. ISL-26]MBT2712776.1 DNA-processing protein DprA [Pseudomonas sp. ISL-88]
MDQTSRSLIICRIKQFISPSLLLKWWKADSTLSFARDPHPLTALSGGKIDSEAIKLQIERESPKLEGALSDFRRQGISVIPISSSRYPSWLKTIYDPPAVLFAKGDASLLEKGRKIGIVGTRKPTEDGIKAVHHLTAELSKKGWIIVSGLAAGIDGLSHKASIRAKGHTIGVIAGGFHHIYPRENLPLAEYMAEHQLLLSEHPPETKPKKWHFPMRNRIISGLSEGIVVVQGKEKSGSLITAYQALEQGREVFAVPGSIFNPYSGGPIKLIQEGAKAVLCAEDIDGELTGQNVQYTEPF